MSDTAAAARATRSSRLVEFLLAQEIATLPVAVVHAARMRLLDSVGCGLYGATTPWGRIAAQVALEEQSRGGATVYGYRDPVTPSRAALVNATATHGIEFDDLAPGHVHPGSLVVPAILAMAEHHQANGSRLVLGIVAGYEATARIALALGEIEDWGFHTSGIAGPVGAAIACGVTLGMEREQIMRAVGIACSYAGGIRAFTQGDGGMIKRMHAGRAAESGVMACALARRGYTAPRAGLEGKFGLLQCYGRDACEPHALDEKLGASYMISAVRTKCYPCYYGGVQTIVQALHGLRLKHGFAPSAIRGVSVGTNQRAVKLHAEVAPEDTMAAQYSIPFTAAVALAADPKDPRCYDGAALRDPAVCALARRVELHADAEIDAMPAPQRGAHVAVELTDGRRFEARLQDAHGAPDDPCSAAEISDKFRTLAAASNTDASIAEVLARVGEVETLPTIAPLSRALRDGVRA